MTPLRRAAPWLVLGVAAIAIATIGALLIPVDEVRPPALSASSAQPDGAMAVAEVLRQHGVDVIETSSLAGPGAALRNDQVVNAGNAALALNLLGQTETLIWYFPGEADLFENTDVSLADLQAPWTVPLTVLLALVAFAAIAWKWRRFGPLV